MPCTFAPREHPRYSPGVPVTARLLSALLAVSFLACPTARKRKLPTIPSHGNVEAKARFDSARQQFGRDDERAASEFERIATEFPRDPIATHARLYAGRAAIKAGDYDRAVTNLRELLDQPDVEDQLTLRGRLFLGIALNYRGQHTEALGQLRTSQKAVHSEQERAEWTAAIAVSLAATDPVAAAPYFDQWFALATTAERAYAVARLTDIANELTSAQVQTAYVRAKDQAPSRAVFGARLMRDAMTTGQHARARELQSNIAAAAKRLGITLPDLEQQALGDPKHIGALLPLSGRRGPAADLAVRGLTLGVGALSGADTGITLSLRDTQSHVTGAEAAVRQLANADVIAAVGPIDGKSTDSASRKSADLGVALISLNGRSDQRPPSSFTFHIVHSAEARARTLARYAYGLGIRDFAVLSTERGYGKVVGRAFREEVKRLGGTIVASSTYTRKTTSFGSSIRKLKKPWQALFVPDLAKRLELIAPALAAANMMSAPWTAKRPRSGRKILLLSTAEFLNASFLRAAGQYARGAVFAPGFFPDTTNPQIEKFVDDYQGQFGRMPTPIAAYAHDAIAAIRKAVSTGATSRQAVVQTLSRQQLEGVTGRISFTIDRRRADPGRLFTIVKQDANYNIRLVSD